jgi:lipopolysaccharide/colanic/teichoic acid biosynthesis glycosyltransferase
LRHNPTDNITQSSGTHQQGNAIAVAGFSPTQLIIKRFIDIFLSLITICIALPVIVLLAIIIKSSGKGAIIFRQERIGKNGKPFMLLKFRTMHDDAEPDGPMLSTPTDKRVTAAGRFMRRHKIDELPNFLNVIRGDMSIVGPRPEREYYLQQLRARNPEVDLLLSVKPGITCTGQVEYGYASDIDQMADRLVYELDYVKSPSLRKDLIIMWQTVVLLLRGRKK